MNTAPVIIEARPAAAIAQPVSAVRLERLARRVAVLRADAIFLPPDDLLAQLDALAGDLAELLPLPA